MAENYMSLNPDLAIHPNQNTKADINNDKSSDIESISSRNKDSLENSNYGFYNKGFEDVISNFEKDQDHPTIEPSFNVTVDSKKCGIVLKTKTYDV